MRIDCDTCSQRPTGCSDCMVTLLLSLPAIELEAEETAALTVLSDAGLVKPLRLSS